MHVVVTRADLGTFAHLHPEPTGDAGRLHGRRRLRDRWELSLDVEFRRRGEMTDISTGHGRGRRRCPAPRTVTEPTRAAPSPSTVSGDLDGDALVGERSDFELSLRRYGQRRAGRRPAAVPRRCRARRGDGRRQTFAHQHAETFDGDGDPVFALPGTTFGPELELHVRFAVPGPYRLWAQFATGRRERRHGAVRGARRLSGGPRSGQNAPSSAPNQSRSAEA